MPGRRAALTVSVLLPTFNRAEFLGEALDSVFAQSHPPLEVIVIDDGSDDGTTSLCAKYSPRLRYVRVSKNGGKTAALNLGLKLAKGDVIWVMDDDDIAPPHAIKSLLTPLQADPTVDFTFGALRKFTSNARGEREFAKEETKRPAGARHLFSHLMEDCFVTGQPCTLFRRRCFDGITPFDPSITTSVDYNILLQVARRNRGVEIDDVVLWQRQHPGARGTVAARYGAHERVQRWRQSDSRLLAQLLPQLELYEFLGNAPADKALTPIQTRRALLQKAVIAGRKDLWDLARDSLVDGLRTASGAPLGPNDLEILSRLLGSRYGIDLFLSSARTQSNIASALRRASNGQHAQIAAASMLTFWVGQGLRKRDLSYIAKCVCALVRLAGPRSAYTLTFGALNRRLKFRPVVGRTRDNFAASSTPGARENFASKATR